MKAGAGDVAPNALSAIAVGELVKQLAAEAGARAA